MNLCCVSPKKNGGGLDMLKKILLLFLIASSIYPLYSEIFWADKVVSYSSQTTTKEFGALQATGKPSIMSDFGLSECAWLPENINRSIEWIKLKFPKAINIKQIVIHENIYPGAITKIILYDSLNRGKQVYTNHLPVPANKQGRLFYVNIDENDIISDEMKIEVNLNKYLEPYQIDAVGISDQQEFYDIKINHAQDTLQSQPENLGPNINSEYVELVPVISADDNILYFVRVNHPGNIGRAKNQDIWYSVKGADGKFGLAQNMGFPINNAANNFIITAMPDGNTLILGNKYTLEGNVTSGISKTEKRGDEWSFPDSLQIEDFYNFNVAGSYAMSPSGKVLLMSLEREDSRGLQDLYVSFLTSSGTWSRPKNLGSTVNTAAAEITPFIASDEETLYFSTSGKPGYGLQDMFVTKRLDDTWEKWSEPLNLGARLNSSNWDAYYTVPASGKYAYFVSANNSFGSEDIFRIKLPESVKPKSVVLIKGKVFDAKTNKPIEAKIIYETLSEGEEAGVARSNPESGEYSIVLPEGDKYGFLAEKEGYIAINENIDLTALEEYQEIEKDLYLVPIEKGQTITLNNIFFNFSEYELLPDSRSELNRIVKFMKQNPEIEIQITGHTDNIGSDVENNELSKLRAQSVADYLTQQGIEMSRLKVRGMGKSKPIATNKTEEGRRKNRRVEFSIMN